MLLSDTKPKPRFLEGYDESSTRPISLNDVVGLVENMYRKDRKENGLILFDGSTVVQFTDAFGRISFKFDEGVAIRRTNSPSNGLYIHSYISSFHNIFDIGSRADSIIRNKIAKDSLGLYLLKEGIIRVAIDIHILESEKTPILYIPRISYSESVVSNLPNQIVRSSSSRVEPFMRS